MKEIIENVFLATVKSYEKILCEYYPAHGSNGFTERNLTFNFSHNYLIENQDAIIWQESPLEKGKHFDTLIIDDKKKVIIVIEAKRLQNEKKSESIYNDFRRINDHIKEITLHGEKLSYTKYGLLLVDVWISKKKGAADKRARLLKTLFSDDRYNDIQHKELEVKIDSFKCLESYHLVYKLFSIDK
jgi:hypothetical protein